jgi:hypothetical protein
MAASTITRSALTNGTTPWSATTINSAVYDKIDELFGGAGTYATLELGGALKINGALTQLSNDGGALGTSSLGWSDLFLASGAVINFNNGDVTITHSANTLTFAGAASGYIFNNGNVGINISSPAYRLDVNGSGQIASTILQEATAFLSNSGNTMIGWSSAIAGYTNGTLILQSRSSAGTPIVFVTGNPAGVDRGRITEAGEWWIGYTTDQGAYLLQVNSQIFATNATIATSDGRFKTDVQPVREGLAAVNALQPVQFKWKKHPVHNFIAGTDVGFIAQDVRAALTGRDYTGAVVTQNGSGDGEFLGMADSKLIPLLVAAVQELDAKVSALNAQ